MKIYNDAKAKLASTHKESKKWKLIADILLYTLPLYLTTLVAAPFPDAIKQWGVFILSIGTVTIKAITKFTTEPEEVAQSEEDTVATEVSAESDTE